MLKTVNVPPHFEAIFANAEEVVGKYFSDIKYTPTKGVITIDNDRYILMRGESIFFNLKESLNDQFGEEVTNKFLYELAKTIGKSDAVKFAEKMNLKDPIQKLSAGPVHFSHAGWGFVNIFPESSPTPDENYFLLYEHPNTFESELTIKYSKKVTKPVCVFSAGYSAGWSSHSFNLELDAKEISCVAKGDPTCLFIMSPANMIDRRIEEYLKKIVTGQVPGKF
ncbi:MAG: XylR N-terminal domain-containing protein [Oligoflexia bacterium]|nr:XylR N-terminal domain-containing protein [Oligoflexia bacterium]